MAERVTLREIGPRDGLQMVANVLPTAQKLEWCRLVREAGVRAIEVTSFVNPKAMPQFADAEEVARGAVAMGGFTASALVPNLRGAARAFDVGITEITCVLSASDAHNRANVNRSTEESIADFGRIVAEARGRGPGLHVGVGIATAFGCTIAGEVPEARVLGIAEALLAHGADEIVMADTVGYASPWQVRRLCSAVVAMAGDRTVSGHFHDTRGLGLANVTAAVEAGLRTFDSSLAGLGGCPFAPGASGNVDSEDTAYLLESLGFDTGIDIDRLVAARRSVEAWLPGERLTGSIAAAGLPKTFRRAAAVS